MSVILCTAGYDHTIRFWEALSGICSRTIQHPDSQVNRLCITPDKRYVAAAGCVQVKLYDIKSSSGAGPVVTFEGHTSNVTGVAFHCEGKWMVTSSEDWTVKVWDTRSGSIQRNYAHKAPVNDVVIHPNQGELISGDGSGGIHVWDLGESRLIHSLYPEEDVSIASVSVASDGSLLCAGNNKGNVYIWRMVQQEDKTSIVPVASFQAHKDYLTRVLLSPDVKHLATCSADHTAKVWSLDPEFPPTRAAVGGGGQHGNTAGENESRASGSTGAVQTTHTTSQVIPSDSTANGRGSASVNGRGLTFAGTNGLNPFERPAQRSSTANGSDTNSDTNSGSGSSSSSDDDDDENEKDGDGNDNNELKAPTIPVDPIPMDPASKTLFLETVLSNHQRWVWDCAFSADSAYLVTVCSDHYARLWELSSGQIIRQYSGHHRGAVCVALNDYSEPR